MSYLGFEMFHDMFTRGEISCPGELSLTTIFPSKKIHNKASSQQVKFVMIRIEFIFSRFKSILLGASGEGFRKQTKEGKSLFTLRGLVSCDANKTSSELPLDSMNVCKWIIITFGYKRLSKVLDFPIKKPMLRILWHFHCAFIVVLLCRREEKCLLNKYRGEC